MIRLATMKDIDVLYELGSLLHENYRTMNSLEKLLQEDYFKIFVAEIEKKVVGFLSITELYETVDILDLYVLEDFRRKHIGSQLINYMISDISDSVSLITLEVEVNNHAAISLYQKFGFEIIHKRLFYYGNNDAYLMGLRCIYE